MVEKITKILRNPSLSVPKLLIQNYKSMGISEFDTLVLIYLINADSLVYNPKLISSFLNTDVASIMVSIDSLSTKGLIEIQIKDSGIREEYLSLDKLYEKLSYYIVNEESSKSSNLYDAFETEFGRELSSMEYQIITGWTEGNYSDELIKAALKEATYNGVNNLRYIDKVLFDWNKSGIKSISDLDKDKGSSKENTAEELFEFDWLNEK